MIARKVVILLAIFALSVLTLFVITLIDGEAFGAEPAASDRAKTVPDTLAFYRETLSFESDGNAVFEVTAVPVKGGFGDLLLPFAFEGGHDFRILSGSVRFHVDGSGQSVPTSQVLGYRMLNLERLESAAAGDTVVVRALVPGWYDQEKARREYGEFAVVRDFVNTSDYAMRRFELVTEFPEGFLAHAVTKLVPAYDPKKSPEPPYTIGRENDRGRVALQQTDLVPAGAVRMEMNIRPARRGPLPLIVGLVVALLYLVFFRDVLKPKEA